MFTKDDRNERFLNGLGASFTYSDAVQYHELTSRWMQENPARPIAIRQDAVNHYIGLMTQNKTQAPAVILGKLHKETHYRVLDGVQRLAAANKKLCHSFSAYIVETDSEDLLLRINLLANTLMQGYGEAPDWTRRKAIEVLVVDRGTSPEEMSSISGWKVCDIVKVAEAIRWRRAIEAIGGPSDTPDTVIKVLEKHAILNDLHQAPEPNAEFLNLMKRTGWSAERQEPYFEEFYEAIPRGKQRHDVYSERLEEAKVDEDVSVALNGRRAQAQPLDSQLKGFLTSAQRTLGKIHKEGFKVRNVDEYYRMLNDIRKELDKLEPKRAKKRSARTPADKWEVAK